MFSTLWLQGRRRPLLSWGAALATTVTTTTAAIATCQQSSPSTSNTTNDEDETDVFGLSMFNANDPMEDRADVQRLELLGGWWFAVFDGHSGWQAAQFAQKELHRNLEVELGNRLGFGHEENGMLGNNKNHSQMLFEGKLHERLVSGALVNAFERTDRVYKSKVQGAFEVGFGRDTRAGSCALGALLVDGVLFVANLGDSRAVLGVNRTEFNQLKDPKLPQFEPGPEQPQDDGTFVLNNEFMRRAAVRKAQGEVLRPEVEAKLREVLVKEIAEREAGPSTPPPPSSTTTITSFLTAQLYQNGFTAIDLSKDHNCREPRERKKLEAEHPDELDVVVCKRPGSCYIKGKLQPTRSFGDFYLKYSEFMRSPDQHFNAGRYIPPPYTPPYISATPEITVNKLRPGVDDFLILGTDGVWDFVTSQEAVNLVGQVLREGGGGNSKRASDALLELVLSRAAERCGVELEQLKRFPAGRERRRRFDDTTIIVIDLKRASEFFWWG